MTTEEAGEKLAASFRGGPYVAVRYAPNCVPLTEPHAELDGAFSASELREIADTLDAIEGPRP